MTIKRLGLVATLAIAGIGVVSLAQREVWDGGFAQVEYQIQFEDMGGRSVQGVTLQVIDKYGNISFDYPVTDFKEGSVPTSDEKGGMVFHHVDLSPEFGGSCRKLFFLLPIGECQAPHYSLRFLLADQVIASYNYSDYLKTAPRWSVLPTVEREWKDRGSSAASLPEHLCPENRSVPSRLRYYVITQTIVVPSS